MSRILFISPDHSDSVGGREQLSRLHGRALQKIFGDDFHSINLPRKPLSGLRAIKGAFAGWIDGVNSVSVQQVLAHIAEIEIDVVWINGSNLGVLAKAIKRRYPQVRIITFFHNVESRFFVGALRHRGSFRTIGIVIATFVAEKRAARASDLLVTLNERDSQLLKRLYGRAGTHLLPMSIEEPTGDTEDGCQSPVTGDYLLFVGGGFYANRAGILWFARHVAPRLSMPTLIVGRGLEPLRPILSGSRNIKLIGEVKQLGPYYRHATAVVAPIFDGSGMKTKVAEAMMHGKRIAGTTEAFTGYEEVLDQAGWRCDSADEFVSVLRDMAFLNPPQFDSVLRLRFDELYSCEAARRRIATIIGKDNSTIEADPA